MNLKVVAVMGAYALSVLITGTAMARTSEDCHSMLLSSCDCSCINKGEAGSGGCMTIQECLQETGKKGKVTCNATPSEEFQKCATPPCPTDCAVIFSFQPEAE